MKIFVEKRFVPFWNGGGNELVFQNGLVLQRMAIGYGKAV